MNLYNKLSSSGPHQHRGHHCWMTQNLLFARHKTLEGRYYYYSHFIHEETEAEKD